ncbi:MAG: phosphatidate cytidylyltransferase [Syntrophomonas sp.]|nr:phosphatidate cytidylyltransferase [Syntrophomonas sp.]
MLRTRIITAVISIPLLIGLLYLGGVYWQCFVALLTGIALFEYFAMMRHKGLKPMVLPAYIIAGILLFREQLSSYLPGLFFGSLFLMIVILVFTYPRFRFEDAAFSFFGTFYIGFLFSYALAIAQLDKPFYYLLLVFILTWASDVGGYLFGKLWGKNKLSPQLSPGKTWEGAWGAVLLTIVLALLFNGLAKIENLNLFSTVLLGILASVTAQVGDLLESAMKRFFAVKDSGHIIPGHGGVLDRFDSFLLLLPVVYYFLVLLA